MTDPNIPAKRVDLSSSDRSRQAWFVWQEAKLRADLAAKELKKARAALDQILADGEEVLLGGVQVAQYRYDGQFNHAKFREEMPHIYEKYTKWVAKPELDVDTLKQDMPTMFEAYRTRSLKLLKGD